MAGKKSTAGADMVFIVAVSLFLVSGVFGWHSLSVKYDSGYTFHQDFAPLGMIWGASSNETNDSALIFYTSSSLNSQNISFPPAVTFNRATVFQTIWLLYIATAIFFLLFGIFRALKFKIAYAPLSFLIAIIVLISVLYFLTGYQAAFDADMDMSDMTRMGMMGGEVSDLKGSAYSSLGSGFLLVSISLVLFFSAGVMYLQASLASAKSRKSVKKPSSRQAAPAAAARAVQQRKTAPRMKRMTLTCPSCGNVFEVEVDMDKLPVRVQCPYCGTEGEIG